MKSFLALCVILLLVSVASFPAGWYMLLRLLITVASIVVIVNEPDKEVNAWKIIFGCIAVLFNPIIPIYLYDKSVWVVIDVVVAIVFAAKCLSLKTEDE